MTAGDGGDADGLGRVGVVGESVSLVMSAVSVGAYSWPAGRVETSRRRRRRHVGPYLHAHVHAYARRLRHRDPLPLLGSFIALPTLRPLGVTAC